MKRTNLKDLKKLLEKGFYEGVYPGAVLLVALKGKPVCFESVGYAALKPRTIPMKRKTIFDLASMTKPLATTLAMMKLVEEKRVGLDEPIGNIFGEFLPKDKQEITSRSLLSHASGLPDWEPFYSRLKGISTGKGKKTVRKWILKIPLTKNPSQEVCYSDLGFIFLEWIVEIRSGLSLKQFLQQQFYGPLGVEHTFFYDRESPVSWRQEEFAATEACPWRKEVLQGKVHDENAYAMGGYSGHAGLFSTAIDVFAIAHFLFDTYLGKRQDLLRTETIRRFFFKQKEPKHTTWALGWDTPSSENSSSGRFFSENSVGHLGFTGTSIWMDLEKEVVVIFLTNRVHPLRENGKIRGFRPLLHDQIMKIFGLDSKRA